MRIIRRFLIIFGLSNILSFQLYTQITYETLVNFTKLTKVGDTDLYIQGKTPFQCFRIEEDGVLNYFYKEHLLRSKKGIDSTISLKFVDTLEINSQRFAIQYFEIISNDVEYYIFEDDDIDMLEVHKRLFGNVLINKDINFKKEGGIFTFTLGSDFIGCKIKIHIYHHDLKGLSRISHMTIREEIKMEFYGDYLIILTPRLSVLH